MVAHRLGVVHRDISSDNLILPAGDVRQAKIIDFGIARGPKTSEGTIIGTGFAGKFRYVSPEQLKSGEVTFKSDIYSFGLVLAEALRGKPIDMGNSPHEAVERRRAVPDLSDVDPGFRPLLRSMLQPDPADRPESMAAIAAWAASTGSRGRDGGPRGNSGAGTNARGSGAGRLAAIAGAVIVVASVATTGVCLSRRYLAAPRYALVRPFHSARAYETDLDCGHADGRSQWNGNADAVSHGER